MCQPSLASAKHQDTYAQYRTVLASLISLLQEQGLRSTELNHPHGAQILHMQFFYPIPFQMLLGFLVRYRAYRFLNLRLLATLFQTFQVPLPHNKRR